MGNVAQGAAIRTICNILDLSLGLSFIKRASCTIFREHIWRHILITASGESKGHRLNYYQKSRSHSCQVQFGVRRHAAIYTFDQDSLSVRRIEESRWSHSSKDPKCLIPGTYRCTSTSASASEIARRQSGTRQAIGPKSHIQSSIRIAQMKFWDWFRICFLLSVQLVSQSYCNEFALFLRVPVPTVLYLHPAET